MDIATNEAEVEALNKIRSGQYELIKKDELEQLKKDAEMGRSVGRYRLVKEGWRTWRLDTATGTTCIMLTTESDWKKPETVAQACLPQ